MIRIATEALSTMLRHFTWRAAGATRRLFVLAVLVVGCARAAPQPVYEDPEGLRLVPPPGWVERARPDAISPLGQAQAHGRGQAQLPLPPLGKIGHYGPQTLRGRYDRLTASRLAFMRISIADIPASVSLQSCLTTQTPSVNWKRAAELEALEVGGQPAVRAAYVGLHDGQEYRCETIAVRKGEQVTFICASFPAADKDAQEQVRRTIASATWQ